MHDQHYQPGAQRPHLRRNQRYHEAAKGMPVPFGRLEKISFDIDESPLAMIDTMPQWIQDTIRESKEYKARTGQAAADQDPAGELFDRIENDEVPF